jgi:hypothetical protein
MDTALHTGDLVMVGPGAKAPGLYARGILDLLGSVHWHDELVSVDQTGVASVGYARKPHFSLVPFFERLARVDAGECSCAVFRWHEFAVDRHERSEWYAVWRDQVRSNLMLMDKLQVRYDWKAILSIARNVLRMRFHLEALLSHHEDRLYCTESCRLIYQVCGIDIMQSLGQQPFPSPIHMERLWAQGKWVLVQDFGLIKQLEERYNV